MAVKPTSIKRECFSWFGHGIYLVADWGSENVRSCSVVPSSAAVQILGRLTTTITPGAIKPDEVAGLTHCLVFIIIVRINRVRCRGCAILINELEPCLRPVIERFDAVDFLCDRQHILSGWYGVPIHVCNSSSSSIRGERQHYANNIFWRLLPDRNWAQAVALCR